jgi:predicted transposase YbfD/YdcC
MVGGKKIDAGVVGKYFESLSDPRHSRNRKHLLVDIIVIAICGILSHAEGPTSIHRWAKAHASWLGQFLLLPNGIPSRDCIRRLLIALQPAAFQKCFEAWIRESLVTDSPGAKRLVAIDGKCCRGSHDRSRELGPLHLVSAWASEQGIALGQVATEEKSNEITAIPQVLDLIDLAHSIVTIDAMGCQKAIVEQIDKGGGTYAIAVKDNQPKLFAAVCEHLHQRLEEEAEDLRYRVHETQDEGHGRIDERAYGVLKLPRDFPLRQEWPSVKAIGYATRVTVHTNGTETYDTRYYILNEYLSGRRFAEAVRGHWAIEAMHWVLDVNFREDQQPTAERTLVNNLSWLRRFAITLLKRVQSDNESLRGRMQMAGWNTDYLLQILVQ